MLAIKSINSSDADAAGQMTRYLTPLLSYLYEFLYSDNLIINSCFNFKTINNDSTVKHSSLELAVLTY
jgi:hypothetical protein